MAGETGLAGLQIRVRIEKLFSLFLIQNKGAQWLSGRVLDSRPKGRGFESHRRHCVVSLSKNINPSLVLVQPRKTRPFITERLLMGRKESNQTKNHPKHMLWVLKRTVSMRRFFRAPKTHV